MMTERAKGVWLVTQGIYSDYHVVCVCLTEDEAKAAAAKLDLLDPPGKYGDPAQVEPAPVATADDVRRTTTLHMSMFVYPDGTMNESESKYSQVSVSRPDPNCHIQRAQPWSGGYRLSISGDDHERVRKVYSEQRARLLADLMEASDQ